LARYGQAFNDKAVARLLPPESALLDEVAREFGVSVNTLEKWSEATLSQPVSEREWSAAARFEALRAAAALNEQECSAWCRAHGVDNPMHRPSSPANLLDQPHGWIASILEIHISLLQKSDEIHRHAILNATQQAHDRLPCGVIANGGNSK
jgi:hypothetical protein